MKDEISTTIRVSGTFERIPALANTSTCKRGDHTNVVWGKNKNGDTLVYCVHCGETLYNGKELDVR